jgi:hypothetical protein
MVCVGGSDYLSVINRGSAIVIYSVFRYKDLFNSGISRVSEICAKIIFNGQKHEPDGSVVPIWIISAFGPQNTAT